jgi:hypothetical protein
MQFFIKLFFFSSAILISIMLFHQFISRLAPHAHRVDTPHQLE